MPPKVTLTFTGLPQGFTEPGKVLRLAVHVAPRLEGAGAGATLNEFKAYFEDWPGLVRDLKIAVQFNPGPKVDATIVNAPASEAWLALFPLETPVKAFAPSDLPDQQLFSYPVGNVLSHLKGIYQTYAQSSPDTFPSRAVLRANPAVAALAAPALAKNPNEARRIMAALRGRGAQLTEFRVPSEQELRGQLLGRMQAPRRRTDVAGAAGPLPKGKAVPPSAPNPPLDFYQVANFFAPHSAAKPIVKGADKYGALGTSTPEFARSTKVAVPEPDFHQMVASLANYPELQVRLGLVIELDVEIQPTMVGTHAAPTLPTLQIVPTFAATPPSPVLDLVRPKTAYGYQGATFAAKPGAVSELTAQGLLRLQDKTADGRNVFELAQTDVDGAALKAMNFGYGLLRGLVHRSADSPLDSSLPALRSVGLQLVRTGAAFRLVGKLQAAALRNTALAADKEPPLFAEDLLRGYRVDVWDSKSKQWRSLHDRHGAYAIDLGPELAIDDEGFTQIGVTGAADGSSADKYLHEIFARWEGWSLSVPRPGTWLSDTFAPVSEPTRAKSPSGKVPLRMEARFTPRVGLLPRLRFGTVYRLRVRGVDVAGQGPTLDATDPADFSAATAEETYLRFEPLPPAVVVLREVLTGRQGESLERMVIRSANTNKSLDAVKTDQVSDRHFPPPRGAWDLCDAHGKFDLPPADAKDDTKIDALRTLITTHEGAFPTTTSIDSLNPPVPANETPQPLAPGAVDPIVTSDKIDPLPYLPDPIVPGVSLINLPGVPLGKHHHMTASGIVAITDMPDDKLIGLARVDFKPGGEWYDLGSFRLHLVDATGEGVTPPPPKWDTAQRQLTVYLPKAEVAEVRFSSFLDEGKDPLQLLGIWRWIEQAGPKNLMRLRRLALDGRHWMISPFRTLVLVHAVQQPLAPPRFVTLKAEKILGKTFATLQDHVAVHGKSTSKIDVAGRWLMWTDPIDLAGPQQIDGRAHVCEVKVDAPGQTSVTLAHRHEFGDTKYRRVRYHATATTRFREYFPTELVANEANITRATTDDAAEPTYKDVEVDVLSSARPESPKVLYVVPAFEWQDQTLPAGAGAARRRVGGWLRVYLDRTWYSSGDDELLGVLFWNDTFGNIPSSPKDYRPFVTQWGNDPVWVGAAASGKPSAASFSAAVQTRYGITLDELTTVLKPPAQAPATKFDVQDPVPKSQTQGGGLQPVLAPVGQVAQIATPGATPGGPQGQVALVNQATVPGLAVSGHKPYYDEVRRLWYVDVHVDTGPAYFPFIRLALVRFQPHSVDNAHVSRVVVADFAQLAPDRVANLSFDESKPREVMLGVYGRRYAESAAGDAPALQVHVETLRTDVPEELGWVAVPGAKVEARRLPQGRGLPAQWYGLITLPTPRGSKRYRIVVREFEVLPSDAHPQRRRGFTIAELQAVGARVVYADAVEV